MNILSKGKTHEDIDVVVIMHTAHKRTLFILTIDGLRRVFLTNSVCYLHLIDLPFQ